MRRSLLAPLLALALPLAAGGGVPASAEPPADPTEALLASVSPAVVPVRGVLKIAASLGGQSMDQEQQATIRGTVVDPSGLVAVPDVVGTITSMFKRILPPGATLSITPSRVRVLLGEDQKEYEAVDVVRDTEAGIAWLQVVEPPGTLRAIDLGGTTALKVGQSITAIGRMARAFDFAPELRRLLVTRRVERPRGMWGISNPKPDLQSLGGSGLPVFDGGGKPVGLLVMRIAEGDRIDIQSLLTGGDDADVGGLFVLPLNEARASLEAAKKRVPDALAKAKAAKEAPPPKEGGGAPAAMDGEPKTPPAPGMDGEPKTPPPPGMGG